MIGQGTWYLDRGDRKRAIAALQRGIDLGMTHIDTAEMYGDAELVIADAIAGRRDELFLVSKVLPSNASRKRHHHGLRAFAEAAEDRSSRLLSAALARLLSARRRRLPRSRNWWRPERSAPGASAISMSTISTNCSRSPARGRIACNQVLYHLQERAIEHAVIPVVREARRGGRRLFAVRPQRVSVAAQRGRRGAAIDRGCAQATPRQVALSFLARAPSVFPIPKASSAEHAAENAGAGDLVLSASEISRDRQGVSARAEAARIADAVSMITNVAPS